MSTVNVAEVSSIERKYSIELEDLYILVCFLVCSFVFCENTC